MPCCYKNQSMTDKFYSGNWEGHYTYGHEYPAERRKIKVGFFVKMVLCDGSLSGTCEEYVTKVHMDRPATLTGIIDGSRINFVKQYACYFEVGEERELIVYPSRPSYEIRYSGTFNPVSRIFSGGWEIAVAPEGGIDGDPVHRFSGNWEMRKV
jgi:hypothetical protein